MKKKKKLPKVKLSFQEFVPILSERFGPHFHVYNDEENIDIYGEREFIKVAYGVKHQGRLLFLDGECDRPDRPGYRNYVHREFQDFVEDHGFYVELMDLEAIAVMR